MLVLKSPDLETEIDSLKRQYKRRMIAGDTDAMFAAQEALSKVAVVQDRVRLAKDRLDRDKNVEEQPQQQPVPATSTRGQTRS